MTDTILAAVIGAGASIIIAIAPVAGRWIKARRKPVAGATAGAEGQSVGFTISGAQPRVLPAPISQSGRLSEEIKQVASSLGTVGNEWFRYEVRFRGLPEQFDGAFIPLLAAGTPTWRTHRVRQVASGEFVGVFFIKTGLSHNTFQRLAEPSGLIFLDVVHVAGAGTGRAPHDLEASVTAS